MRKKKKRQTQNDKKKQPVVSNYTFLSFFLVPFANYIRFFFPIPILYIITEYTKHTTIKKKKERKKEIHTT